jgi:hypothetical protein
MNRRHAQTPQTFWPSDMLGQKQQSLRDKETTHHTDILAADIQDINHIRENICESLRMSAV